jgi:hypothetical protein
MFKTILTEIVELVLDIWIWKIRICPSTWLRVVSPSTLLRTVSLPNGWSNHLGFRYSDFEFN